MRSQSGHSSVSLLIIIDKSFGRHASPHLARMTIRRIGGVPSLAYLPADLRSPHCPHCGLPASSLESLKRHVARCPNGGACHLKHHGLIKTLRAIVEEAGVPKATIVEEARGLRTCDASRSRDLVVLNFTSTYRHLVTDGVVTTVYMNSILT